MIKGNLMIKNKNKTKKEGIALEEDKNKWGIRYPKRRIK